MEFLQNRDASLLNADEASAIETAVRTAVMSILKVFCSVNEKRTQCYEVKLAETERENTALRFQLKAAEQEIQRLRHISSTDQISAEVTLNYDFSPEERGQAEPEAVQTQESLVLKEEEPSYEFKECLKSEMTEETFVRECEHPVSVMDRAQTPGAEMWSMHTFTARPSLNQTTDRWIPGDVLTGRLKSRECVRRYRERIRADPEKYLAWKEKERLRYQQKRKTINDLSEPMKKLKRKAWREAKRRDRARKQGDYKVVLTSGDVILTCNKKDHSRSFRRRKRIQDLPEPMQKLQRKAWREATRRHRARKMAQATLTNTDMTQMFNP